MKEVAFSYLILVLLLGCGPVVEEQSDGAQDLPPIQEVFESFYEEGLKLNPLFATFLGINRYLDQFPNYLTEDYRTRKRDYYRRHLEQVQHHDRASLSVDEQLNYDILVWVCNINLFPDTPITYLMPINQIFSTNLFMGQFASGASAQPFNTVEDYQNWLSRLKGYNQWLDTAVVNMRKGIEMGYVHPKSIIKKIIPQFEAMDHGPVEEHLFYSPIKKMPDSFTEGQKDSITSAYKDMVTNQIINRYKTLSDFFKNEYLAAGRETSGIANLTGGDLYYGQRIKFFTTTDLSPDSIFNLGLSEVARIEKEMEKVKSEIGFEGSLKEFFIHVRNNQALMPFDDPQQVIDNFNAIHQKMIPNLEKLFDMKPKTPFEVRRTEAFREASASAQYNLGAIDGSRPGIFYVPIPDVSKYNVYRDEDLFLHEAIPGHHYQIMLSMENENMPNFRKLVFFGAYIEGWALYTESLGKELGLYDDPYQFFGMLSAEMHRAIRLVVDAGLHYKGWTREEAIEYSLDHEAQSEANVISEIERYMVAPGQALSYKIGQLTILRLRNKAKQELAENFDIKAFHRVILETGAVPVLLLEERINRWIEERKQST